MSSKQTEARPQPPHPPRPPRDNSGAEGGAVAVEGVEGGFAEQRDGGSPLPDEPSNATTGGTYYF